MPALARRGSDPVETVQIDVTDVHLDDLAALRSPALAALIGRLMEGDDETAPYSGFSSAV